MRPQGMSTVAMLALALGLAACTVPPEQRAHDVCEAYCSCVEVGTTSVAQCVDGCVPNVPIVSDECLDCVYQNSGMCSSLISDCDDPCSQATPLLGGMK